MQHPGRRFFSPNAVLGGVARGAVHGEGADLDSGALLEGCASGQAKQSAAAVGVDKVLGASFLSSRDHVVHHVGQHVRVVLEKLTRLLCGAQSE